MGFLATWQKFWKMEWFGYAFNFGLFPRKPDICFDVLHDIFFKQYLPHVVPLAFSSCNLDDGAAVIVRDSYKDEDVGIAGVSSDDEAENEPRVRNLSIRTGVLDEKAAAIQALGRFALHTKSAYAPYPF